MDNNQSRKKQNIVRMGSRESRLAVVQSQLIMEQIAKYHPELSVELITMKTTGDKILDRTLDKVGGKGLFVKELDRALMQGSIDFAVHSLKDMPVHLRNMPDPQRGNFFVAAYSKREDPRDVLVLPKGASTLDVTKPIGCASQRRTVQLKKLFPSCAVTPIRGNVLTRLEKLDRGEYGALVLAYAGLKRLSLADRIDRIFEPWELVPAAGQGIMAVEGRQGEDYTYLKEIDNEESRIVALAEQAFVRELDGDCSVPVAAFAEVEGKEIKLRGMYCKEGETEFVTGTKWGDIHGAEALAVELARELKKEWEGKDKLK